MLEVLFSILAIGTIGGDYQQAVEEAVSQPKAELISLEDALNEIYGD